MARVKLKDGRVVDIPFQADWDDAAKDRAIAEYKANPDPSETDDWGTYLGKQALSVGRQGAAGLAGTADLLSNLVPGGGISTRVATRLLEGEPIDASVIAPDFTGQPTRDLYEKHVPLGPRGSDYETTGQIAEVAVPAVVETLMTGSPKSALWRAPRDIALGVGGGAVGEEAVRRLGGGDSAAELGRLFSSVLLPAIGGSRTGAKIATATTGLPFLTSLLNKVGLGRLDPYKLIPPSTPADAAKRALVGATASSAYDYEENR